MHSRFLHASACGLMLVTVALADPPVSEDQSELIKALRDEVSELRTTVDELKAAHDPDRELTEARANEIRGLVDDALADADTRANMLAQGTTAGWDKVFFLQSDDGNYRLEINGQVQTRFIVNSQNDASDGKDRRWGFAIRRAKMSFSGHLFDPTWGFFVQGGFDGAEDGEFELEDALLNKDLGDGLAVVVGQFKAPFLFEEKTSSKRQLAVERSLVNEAFNQDRSLGVEVRYEQDSWRAYGMWGDGFGSRNRRVVDSDPTLGLTGRVEFLVTGEWALFKDFSSPRGAGRGWMIGVAGHYQHTDGSAGDPDIDRLTYTIDTSIEFGGASIFAYVVANNVDSTAAPSDLNQLGAVVQGGYYLFDDWEAFVRYEFGDSDIAGEENLNVITIGANYFLYGNALKWTTDIGFGLTEVSPTFASSGTGWRADSAGNAGQIVFRSQLQLYF